MTQYSPKELVERTAADVHPPLYYLLLKSWLVAFGTAPAVLRGFSVLWGGLAVAIMYAVCLEAQALRAPDRSLNRASIQLRVVQCHSGRSPHGGGQNQPECPDVQLRSFFGRVECLAPTAGIAGGMLASGLVDGLCACNYRFMRNALLWLFHGHGPGAVCCRLPAGAGLEKGWSACRPSCIGFGFACLLAVVAYSPWLPVLWSQTQAVRQGYWIPSASIGETERVFGSWATGLEGLSVWEIHGLEIVTLIGVIWMLLRNSAPAWFFLLQAAIPWALSLALSIVGDRPIFLERYLIFAHLSFLGFGSLIWTSLRSLPSRLVATWLLGSTCLAGLADHLTGLPDSPAALTHAAAYLKSEYRDGDVICTESPSALNQLRYYAKQVGLNSINMRCPAAVLSPQGHTVHLASLQSFEIIPPDSLPTVNGLGRLWVAGAHFGDAALVQTCF